ncbi:MFS transporter [Formosimonas limnophila]|uniref:MFS transporter n=1 Tax=Formosimonas limnophila TaxID=1384487 RepID=A0A8J3FYU4_9BURK|nr:MFS transporter [Formosimonas limnophila]GHA76172.1 MFS transporter [Formosimonas limnophila]
MSVSKQASNHYMPLVIVSCVILMVTMGIRQSSGLFVAPLVASTGLSISVISLAMAIGQFMWGVAQPLGGLMAERVGSRTVVATGVACLAAGMMLVPWMQGSFGVFATFGVLAAVGSGLASFSVLMGAAAQRVPENKRGFASGLINAGSSMGQFIFAPLTSFLITAWGWATAALSLGLIALASLPLLAWVTSRSAQAGMRQAAPSERISFGRACHSSNYQLLHLGFFTCGFHIAFLVTHLPGEISICGLPASVAGTSLAVIGAFNIVGSLVVGQLCQTRSMPRVLGWLYLIRAIAVVAYVFASKTEWTWYIFSAVLGASWLATVPPTAGMVGQLFGPRNLATLFGMTMLSHQIGAFLGAYLGGLAIQYTSSYNWMWWADAALALLAALASFTVKLPKPQVLKAA